MRNEIENRMVIGDYYGAEDSIDDDVVLKKATLKDAYDFVSENVDEYRARIMVNYFDPGNDKPISVHNSNILFDLMLEDDPHLVHELAYDLIMNQAAKYIDDYIDWLRRNHRV